MNSSKYVEQCRKEFSLYVIRSRAIPAITDGLKTVTRRILWTARNGEKYKSAVLAGATMPIHPHASPDEAINTIAAPYGNNIPLLTGYGAFGTLLNPKDYGASRYTSVKLSQFTKDVILKDIEIIPMMENYDSTLEEPQYFLPLVPLVLVNPTEGIAVGFTSDILPRRLDDIIIGQITYLTTGKNVSDPNPCFTPLDNCADSVEPMKNGLAYYFKGEFERISASTIKITKIPYGVTHSKVIAKIDAEMDSGLVVDKQDASRDIISITVKFKKGTLSELSDDKILNMFGLRVRYIEHLNVLDFSGQSVTTLTPSTIIKQFCDWRLGWYIQRYQRLKSILEKEIQRYIDVKLAIDKNIGNVAKKTTSRSVLNELLEGIGIVNIDYIADLPIYRFTEEEKIKNEQKIEEAQKQLKIYEDLLNSEDERKKVFVKELKEILTNYNKGIYE